MKSKRNEVTLGTFRIIIAGVLGVFAGIGGCERVGNADKLAFAQFNSFGRAWIVGMLD